MRTNLLLFTGLLTAFVAQTQSLPQLNIGDTAPLTDIRMNATDGKSYSLSDVKGRNGLVVIFSCNTCPFVLGWEDQYNLIFEQAKAAGLGMILINSNEAFREKDDSFEAMVAHAKKNKYKMPYVVDENHQLADAFGAQTTPHVFVFDAEWKLVFKGSINDKYENSKSGNTPAKFYLSDALNAIKENKPIEVKESRAIGCSIKRIKKS
ncbi:thioredoxin family protein [Schleiferia thermophila]|nr:thioredoxin family protein [Schleiferia thermophila]